MLKFCLRSSYRWLNKVLVNSLVLPIFLNRREIPQPNPEIVASEKNRRVWFHAASVGELEALWPLVLLSAERKDDLIVTILSQSAEGALQKLKQELVSLNGQVVFIGYSPWEGQWRASLAQLKPDLFVTAKYEAWPDLWISLQELQIELVMISVKARRSLKIAKWFCTQMGQGIPKLKLLPVLSEDIASLRSLFPDGYIEAVGDPRWDRVYSRLKKGNPRAQQLIQRYQGLKKPWGVVGSAWLEDLVCIQPALESYSGCIWIVPHRVDSENILKIKSFLISCGLEPVVTSNPSLSLEELQKQKSPCILVDEMGFLMELYSLADWAFVGGGFGAGIHSTIEPAIYGVPIASGPKNAEKFSEIGELRKTGQMSLIFNSQGFLEWLNRLSLFSQNRGQWIEQAYSRLDAAQKIMAMLEKF